MARMRRRDFLTVAAGLAAACVAGCGRVGPDHSSGIATTYIPESYDDLYPGVTTFLDTAAERSGGRLTFDTFHSGTLLGAEELLPGLLTGVTDVMFQTSSYVSSSHPILSAMELPFIPEQYSRYRRAGSVDGPLHELINEQLAGKGVRMLGGIVASFEYLWTIDQPIRTPEDVSGRRIRVAGQMEGETVKALGGAPVTMASSEIFQALERGTIDGMMSYVGTIISRDLQEIIRYGTAAHFGGYTYDAYCRSDWYDAQDATVRAALDEAAVALNVAGTDNMLTVHEEEYLPAIEEAGVEFVELTEPQLAAFRDAVTPVYQRWRSALRDPELAETVLDVINNA